MFLVFLSAPIVEDAWKRSSWAFFEQPSQWVENNFQAKISVWEYLPPVAYAAFDKKADKSTEAKYVNFPDKLLDVAEVTSIPNTSSVKIDRMGSRTIVLSINAKDATKIIFKQFHWKYWQARNVDTNAFVNLSADSEYGLTALRVAKGEHKIELRLPMLMFEKIGYLISLTSLLILLLAWQLPKWRTKPELDEA